VSFGLTVCQGLVAAAPAGFSKNFQLFQIASNRFQKCYDIARSAVSGYVCCRLEVITTIAEAQSEPTLSILSDSGTPSSLFRPSLPFGGPSTRNQSRLKERSPELLVLQLAGKTSRWLKSRTSLPWRLIYLMFRKNISVENPWKVIVCTQIESSMNVLCTAYNPR
jgi:hypothetical protein